MTLMNTSNAAGPHPVWLDHPTVPAQIVLEGGSLRNLFTAGVLDFFLDQGFLAESVVGVSAGALCGYSYAAGEPGQTARYNLQYRPDWRFASIRSFITTGNLIGTRFLCDTLPNEIEHLDHSWFTESPIRLVSVATDLRTGEPDYHVYEKGEDFQEAIDYLVACSSQPYISRPVEVDGKLLVDGGVADRIPYRRGQERYLGRQVVVLTRSPEFVQGKTYDTLVAPVLYGRYPAFVQKMIDRPATYVRTREEVAEAARRGELFVIQPQHELDIGTFEKDTDKLFAGYVAGLEEAARRWGALREYLGLG